MAGEGEKVKKSRDPILMVCFVVFLVATVAVTAAHIDRHYIQKDMTEANNGYTVSVNYTGTYYDYIDGDNAVLFDTSVKSIANDSKVVKANDYETKLVFNKLEFKIGSDGYIMDFQNAIVGHKAGDVVKVCVKGDRGYPVADLPVTVNSATVQKISAIEIMPASVFESIYGFKVVATSSEFKSVYGWDATASLNSADNTVSVQYKPVAGTTYDFKVKNGAFGKVTANVVSVTGSEIQFKYGVSGYKKVGTALGASEIQMIKVDMGTKTMYITSVQDAGGTVESFTYKTVGEKYNQDLYFKITVEKVTKA